MTLCGRYKMGIENRLSSTVFRWCFALLFLWCWKKHHFVVGWCPASELPSPRCRDTSITTRLFCASLGGGGGGEEEEQSEESSLQTNTNQTPRLVVNNKWQRLTPLGPSRYLLEGEQAQMRRRRRAWNDKPQAVVRLVCFYGVGDATVSLRPWVTAAPDWCQVRLVELPAHGYLAADDASSDDPSCLPPCAFPQARPQTRAQIRAQCDAWVNDLARQIEPLLRHHHQSDSNGGTLCRRVPCAFFGFSWGALLAYQIALTWQQQLSSLPLQPVALFACGRGAPHAMIYNDDFWAFLQTANDDTLAKFVQDQLGISMAMNNNNNRSSLQVARLRLGMLWSGIYFGQTPPDENTTTFPKGGCLWNDLQAAVPHAESPPLLDCPVVSITGSDDKVWPPRLVQQWSECCNAAHYYHHFELPNTAHGKLMNAPETMQIVFDELERLVLGVDDNA